MATEEPAYSVLKTGPDYEIRRYEPYIVAEVDVQGAFDEAGNTAFRILAGYIFGDNGSGEKMRMTAPVESKSVRMAMTAPVISNVTRATQDEPGASEPVAPNGEKLDSDRGETYTYAFVMQSSFTMETLPLPNDARIRLRPKPSRVLAARRYGGRWSEENYLQNEVQLRTALHRDQLELSGEPFLARYNSPFMPWFLRRNEVIVEVVWP